MTLLDTRTAAEQAIAQHFDAISSRLQGDASVRRKAIARFNEVGWPHRRIEEWKYTDLRNVLKVAFPPAEHARQAVGKAELLDALGPFATLDAYRLVLVDGFFAPELSNLPETQSGVVIAPLSATPVVAQSRAPRSLGLDGVLAFNDAFVTDGATLRVRASPDKPIMIVSLARAAIDRKSVV